MTERMHKMSKEIKNITGMMCREAYNGNCVVSCEHSPPHEKNRDCQDYCIKKYIQTECIEIEYIIMVV